MSRYFVCVHVYVEQVKKEQNSLWASQKLSEFCMILATNDIYYHLVHYRPNAFDHKVKIQLFNPPKYPDETKTLQSATVWINKLFLQFNTLLKIPDCCCTALISMCQCQQLRHHQWHHHTPTCRSDSSGTPPGERDKEPGAVTCSQNVPHWNLIERHGTGSNKVSSSFFF